MNKQTEEVKPLAPESKIQPSSRRDFLKTSTMAGIAAATFGAAPRVVGAVSAPTALYKKAGPIAISSRNGQGTVLKAIEMIQSGADALDAVVAGVNLVEEDPEDTSVGYGGLPNANGVVQLDSAVMHGPTCRAGSVACIEGIKYPSKVAKLVLERTDHVNLMGKGAQEFAAMHGFPIENLLTEKARKEWVRWKENMSTMDEYLPPHKPGDKGIGALSEPIHRHWGTIHCSAIDLAGNISCVTTTSGLAFKIPGRVGDSPIIGAGLYCDNEVGAAGSTGRGEANLENLASFLIVERMRAGDSPEQACLVACQRIADHTKLARLQDSMGRPDFNVQFYALNMKGEVGGAEIRGGNGTFAVATPEGGRLVKLAYLYKNNG
ncbi:isoaspartyl peptidase/L-asparaginase [bacterium]|nr:isoaspartyl peptidase/L-asparaginase [bacterium]